MIFFTVKNWRLEPTPELLQVAAFAAILQADRTAHKKDAIADLLYIYGMVQPKGPFSDFAVGMRDRMVRKNTYGEVDAGPYEHSHPVRWNRIIAGIRAFMDGNVNADQRLFDELQESVDWVTDSLRTIRSKPLAEVKAIDIKNMISSLKEVNVLLESKKQAEKLLEVGLEAAKQKSRAGAQPSPIEKGLMKHVLNQRNIAADNIADDDDDA